MSKKRFETELEKEWIGILLEMPREVRQKELQNCDLNSLAKAMITYPNWQVELMAEVLQPPLAREFIKAVKIYKGELPFPKKIRKRVLVLNKRVLVLNKFRLAMSIFWVVLLVFIIFVLNIYFPS